jgi:hypothetical protein
MYSVPDADMLGISNEMLILAAQGYTGPRSAGGLSVNSAFIGADNNELMVINVPPAELPVAVAKPLPPRHAPSDGAYANMPNSAVVEPSALFDDILNVIKGDGSSPKQIGASILPGLSLA